MEITRALTEFLNEERSCGRSPATVRFYKSLLRPFLAFFQERGLTDVSQIGRPEVRAFFSRLGERCDTGEITRATVAAYDRSVRVFFSFCISEGWMAENPMDGRPRIRPPYKLPDTLSMEEVQALLSVCGDEPKGRRDRALMLLMLDTGLRAGEVCSLVLDDLTLEEDEGEVRVQAKNSKDREERRIPIQTETIRAVRKYLEVRPQAAEALFLSAAPDNGKLSTEPLTTTGLYRMIHRRAKQAGIGRKHKWCHIWRHTFAKYYVLGGGDLESLRRFLGHSSLDTVRIYLGFQSEELRSCHRKFSPVRQLFGGCISLEWANTCAANCRFPLIVVK